MKGLLPQGVAPVTAEQIEEIRKRVCEKFSEILRLASNRERNDAQREECLRSLREIRYELENCEPEERGQLRKKLTKMESREDFLRRTAESIEEQLFLHKAGVPSLIDQYAKVSCRGLCQKFHAAFPRELRDKIYECVLGSKTVEVQEKELAEFAMETVVPYFRVVGTTDKLGSPHYWNPAYVGAEVLRELTGTWYRVSTFDFNARTFLIPRFLDEDRWGQGLKPRELASKVKIQIWAVCLKYSYIFEQLESLFGFKNHVSLHIEIDSIGYGEWWEDDWFRAEMSGKEIEKTMEVILPIFPILNRLKDAGFRLSVWLGSQCNITPHNAKFSSGKCLKMVEDWMQSQRKEC